MQGPTVVWQGRQGTDGAAALEALLAELQQTEARRRLRENYHLHTYRIETKGDQLRVTFGGDTPLALTSFLKAHRYWPGAWQHESRGPVVPPGQDGYTVQFDLADEPPA
jgi:hypothetical protein